MKVLISAPSLDPSRNVSGVSTVVRQIWSVLGDRVEFVHLKVGAETGKGRVTRTLKSLGSSALAGLTLLRGHYDVFHSNTALNPKSIVRDSVLVALARLRGRAVVLHLHGGRFIHDDAPPILRTLIGVLVRLTSRVVVLSRIEQAKLESRFRDALGKTAVIYNGVDVTDPPVRGDRRAEDVLTVGFVGRLVPEKGIDAVLRAAARSGDDSRLHFVVYGDGALRSDVIAAAEANPNVSYRGVFDSGQTKSILATIDVLVLPSIHGEGMPMAILEAMAAGAVPYATAISSIPEVIEDGVTGFLANGDANDPLDRLPGLADLETLGDLSRNAMAFAQSHFDARVNYGRLLNIYQAVVERP